MEDSGLRVYDDPPNTPDGCSYLEINQLVKAIGYDFLLDTLELDDAIFKAEYPEMASVSQESRQAARDILCEHVQECRACDMQASADRIWTENFARFLKSDDKRVRAILKDQRRSPRGKARSFVAGSA